MAVLALSVWPLVVMSVVVVVLHAGLLVARAAEFDALVAVDAGVRLLSTASAVDDFVVLREIRFHIIS